MSNLIQVNYEEMQGIISMLDAEKADIQQMYQKTKQMADALHGSQWIGEAADHFYEEMNAIAFPRTQKMIYALEAAAGVAGQIMQIVQQADEETKGYFSNIA
ncbi:MAG: WXG100 family type VII secretion target [Bacteroidetes bacterium]|nr:WXG100 family type VII secretion target [Bacteroidota bacterium]